MAVWLSGPPLAKPGAQRASRVFSKKSSRPLRRPFFEKYFRVKSATGYHVAGTGLGLPVARAIVEAHGGCIWVESKLGQGTTLFFSLPRPASSEEWND